MRHTAAIVLLFALTFSFTVQTANLNYASREELSLELADRRLDIARTESRLAALNETESRVHSALQIAMEENRRAETTAATRARLYYLISKQGGAIRYLLDAASVTEMLKRAKLMKRLLIDGLDARREAGLKIAATQQRLSAIREEKEAALAMHAMLTRTLAELIGEIERRNGD